MKEKLKKKPVIFVALLFTVLLIGGTVAYYYSDVVLPNEFQTMTYNVQIKEEDFTGNLGPKKVFITNQETTNTPVVLRVSYNEYIDLRNGEYLSNTLSDGTPRVTKTWTNAFLNDFTLGSDGCYYYKKVLKPQSQVQILESIAKNALPISTALDYHLDFNFEAIQADTQAVASIWNKTCTINGDNVTW